MAKLMAYCLKTKSKEEMLNAVIKKTAKGGFQAQGTSKEGHKMSLMMKKESAEAAIKEGVAKQGW